MTIHRKKKGYYVGMDKKTGNICISNTKTKLAEWLNISDDTVRRHLSKSNSYENNDYKMWKDVIPLKCRRGREF
jgi:hypothetical protein